MRVPDSTPAGIRTCTTSVRVPRPAPRQARHGSLWTSQVRPAAVPHPVTGETVWFNQADLWHWSALGARGASLLKLMGPERLSVRLKNQ